MSIYSKKNWTLGAGLLILLLLVAGCGAENGFKGDESAAGEAPIMVEALEGLIVEGEGPIPARLIYRSNNYLSNEADRLVLEEIAIELDRLVELAVQLDDAINQETYKTEGLTAE